MHLPVIILVLIGTLLPLFPQTNPAPSTPLPTPSILFENLAHTTKPLWRQLYRAPIDRTVTDREKAALALGIVSAEQALATMARDAQQLRNLLQDEQALEKMLSIVDKMDIFRQRILSPAEKEDWPSVTNAIERTHERQLELLQSLRDQDLATLVATGRWLRTWQITTKVVIGKNLPDHQLAIGTPELVKLTSTALDTLASHTATPSRLLRLLQKRLTTMEKLWRDPSPGPSVPELLRSTQELLEELLRAGSE